MRKLSNLLILASLLSSMAASPASSGKWRGIYYEIKGKGHPLVFLHGGQMDRRMWDDEYEFFARHYRVIRYDIRGFGKSDTAKKPYSDAEDLYTLLRHLGLKEATLVGLSLGGAISVDFAILHPETVRSLILVCPGLGGFHFEDPANDLRAVIEAAQEEDYRKAADLWLGNPYMAVAM